MKPTIGRIVHYKVPGLPDADAWRPAMVTAVFPSGDDAHLLNLTVFLDQANDARNYGDEIRDALPYAMPPGQGVHMFPTSAAQGDHAGEWRWPPRAA